MKSHLFSMSMHSNSIEAYRSLNLGERCALVLSVYANGSPLGLTDRQCMTILGFSELNQVRPRITELIGGGYLKEICSVKCDITNRKVRVCRLTDEAKIYA